VTNVPTGNSKSRDFGQLAEHYKQQLMDEKLNGLASSLGVSTASLNRLNVGWDGKAYTFPMSNDFGKIIGIQRRFPNGRKVSVKHSKTGLFIPSDLPAESTLLICEGPTDTAAALDLGYAAFGRPSCNSKVEMTANFTRGRAVIIVSDNDSVGRSGSKKLARILSLSCPSVKIIYPPEGTKDLRQWFTAGLSKEILQELIQKIKPIEIRISFRD
jgi:DNA primase